MFRLLTATFICTTLAACTAPPLAPFSTDGPPLVMMPATMAGIEDGRGRFREITCAVIEHHGPEQPHYESCEKALTRVGSEGGASGEAVYFGPSKRDLVAAIAPGIGWECFRHWLDYEDRMGAAVKKSGYRSYIFELEGLSGTATNARLIRDRILESSGELHPAQVVLMGYSKGAPDILEAIVRYPEIHRYVAAVVSVAGAIGGSPLAYDASESQLDLLRHIPDATCTEGDGEGVSSLHPAVRQAWLAKNPLPRGIPYYSVVTFPDEGEVSQILKGTYKKLAAIDPRNDSQMMVYDQIIPGSTLVGYLNADHWAIAVPVTESHPYIGKTFVDQNEYPRQAVLESVLRFVEEDLERKGY